MDVKNGFCWRCNKGLHNQSVKCNLCSIAEYCSDRCKTTDGVRHTSVECPTWSKTQKCNGCGQTKGIKKCSGCYTTCYCSIDCQRRDLKSHYTECQKWHAKTMQVANVISKVKLQMVDYPFYFSNSMAKDVLSLPNNEFRLNPHVRKVTNLNILFAACGDLRHVMQTIKSLPDGCSAVLRFVLNDIDPFVMARNVLLLFLAITLPLANAPNIASIWLSLQLTKEDFQLLESALSNLTELSSSTLRQLTSGVIEVNDKDFSVMCCIWARWSKLKCLIGRKDCINLLSERKAMFDIDHTGNTQGVQNYLKRVPSEYIPSVKKWYEDGVIIPAASCDKKLKYYNPTFTGRTRTCPLTFPFDEPAVNSMEFHYCVRADCIPFQMWDFLEMSHFKQPNSVTELCHSYTTECIIQNMKIVEENRLRVQLWTKDFLDLPSFLPKEESFDRIVTSNIIDYYGICKVIKTLEPFLSKENVHATLFTETMNWITKVEGSFYPSDDFESCRLVACAQRDTNKSIFDLCFQGQAVSREYYNNMPHFACYIRGQKLANSSSQKLPRMSDISFGGLHLRNIFKGRNNVVPFNNRSNVRPLNMLIGTARTLEWHRELRSDCQVA